MTDEMGPVVWMNGDFAPLDACWLSPLDRGFLYGDGLFETLRAESGRPLFLNDHIERLTRSMADLRLAASPLPRWDEILPELLSRNGLGDGCAAVKIVVSRGAVEGMGLPPSDGPSILITTRRYHPPPDEEYSRGWRLITYQDGFSPPLSMHKSLNYLFYMKARQAALDVGAHEALLLDPWGFVSETAAGSLLACTGETWWSPLSRYQLPGVTLEAVSRQMSRSGWNLQRRQALLSDLFAAETVFILNSLMLVMPVESLDGRSFPRYSPKIAENLRQGLLHGLGG